MDARWHKAEVLRMKPHLGYGYEGRKYVYVRRNKFDYTDKNGEHIQGDCIHVVEGENVHAPRVLTKEQCREAVRIIGPVDDKLHETLNRSYRYAMTR